MLSFKFIKDMNRLLLNLINSSMVPKISTVANTAMLKVNRILRELFNRPSMKFSMTSQTPPSTTSLPSKVPIMELPKVSYDLYRLEEGPYPSPLLTKEEALNYFKDMQRIRILEKLVQNLYLERKIRGFCHLYIGQEACAVGIKAIMGPMDTVITTYRCHGWALLMGETMENILAELLGKTSGSSRGKGGSMHIYGTNFYGGNGIVGAHVPVGTGIALAHRYNNNGAISWTIFGDGAADQGQIFESFNMAKLWNLPVVYIIENNMYSMGTAVTRHSANPNYYTKGDLIPGIRVDGMDLLAIREAGQFAVNHIKREKGPIILQLDTYRYVGHSMSDPGTSYRSKNEIKQVKQSKDCIRNLVEKIIALQLTSSDELRAIEKNIKKDIKEVLEKCQKAKEPALEEIHCDIYRDYKYKVKMPAMNSYKQHKNVNHLIKKI